jgi:Glycosyltransferase
MMSEVCKQYPEMLLVLIGEGEIEQELKELSREMGIQKNIIFLGVIKQQRLAGFLPAAALYVAGHSGRALAEAALAGLPMVVYDYEWHPELVKQGVTGELAPFGDWKKLAQGVCSILSDKQYANRLGNNARKLGMELLNQEKIIELEKASYVRLLDNHFQS